MPKYRITGSYGFAGTDFVDEVEYLEDTDPEEVAMEYFREIMCEKLSCGAELIEDEDG